MKAPSIAVAALVMASALAWSVQADELSEMKNGLICQCSCNLVLASCQDMMECAQADKMVNEIVEKLQAAQPPALIIAGLVERYGKAVLAAPPKQGFDLAAWVTPFVAIAIGLLVLTIIVRHFVTLGRQRLQDAALANIDTADLRSLRDRLQSELKDYV